MEGRVRELHNLTWGWRLPCLPGAPPGPASIHWGLGGPTSGEPGLRGGADRFSPLPGNCKSCWLLLGAGWGGQRREDSSPAWGGAGEGEANPGLCVPGCCAIFYVLRVRGT